MQFKFLAILGVALVGVFSLSRNFKFDYILQISKEG